MTLLIDLERYEPEDMVWQAPGTPLPRSLVWCTECAIQMSFAGDPIDNFREFGFPDNSPDGPYAQFLRRRGRGIRLSRPPHQQ
ncbi:hypothetical protein SCATT_32300 [Streptantibioticus cattleyicolor NRRL 8057 = DSM 46488]|uniref:Uncharacterized protein n=1 Tax=Streptantibioticus cattleyicolor (strain ATCC 35852 / DSM 46488 / JCM 4925 / NBRC 14057 / NRRL 8057) TaxID=1003195 RepID=G8X000_STREN|nr:hypothetical protein SCATT_32300 [Streptantibioticus cattleyicolor NRRL 8057 = DSM 46488]